MIYLYVGEIVSWERNQFSKSGSVYRQQTPQQVAHSRVGLLLRPNNRLRKRRSLGRRDYCGPRRAHCPDTDNKMDRGLGV